LQFQVNQHFQLLFIAELESFDRSVERRWKRPDFCAPLEMTLHDLGSPTNPFDRFPLELGMVFLTLGQNTPQGSYKPSRKCS